MIIRREQPSDAESIDAVHRSAFADSSQEPVEVGLVRALRASAAWLPALSMVAERAPGEIVGHVCLTRGHLAGEAALGLAPLGVRADAQQRGVGSALMHASVAVAEALDERMVVLLGDPDYYRRFGFVAATELGITPEVAAWGGPHFQARAIGDAPTPRGTFRYAPAFAELE